MCENIFLGMVHFDTYLFVSIVFHLSLLSSAHILLNRTCVHQDLIEISKVKLVVNVGFNSFQVHPL